MFFKGSRYRDLPEISETDAEGQTVRSRVLRWIPDTPGRFLHTVNQTDRLDLVADEYYGDPRKWWLICDANPEFPLPTDLLDASPIMQEVYILEPPEIEVFTLELPTNDGKWSMLKRALQELNGVFNVQLGPVFKVQPDRYQAKLSVTYSPSELNRKEIEAYIGEREFVIGSISELENWPVLVRALEKLRGIHEVQADVPRSTLLVTCNHKELNREELANELSRLHFAIQSTSKKERIGKKIIIPPNRIV